MHRALQTPPIRLRPAYPSPDHNSLTRDQLEAAHVSVCVKRDSLTRALTHAAVQSVGSTHQPRP